MSWIIVDTRNNKAVAEIWTRREVKHPYKLVPVGKWLASLSKRGYTEG